MSIHTRTEGATGPDDAIYTAEASEPLSNNYLTASDPLDAGSYEFGVCVQTDCAVPSDPMSCPGVRLTDLQLTILEVPQ